MTLTVDVAMPGERLALGRARVAEIARAALRAEGVRDALLSIAFLSSARMAALNRRHLAHRGATDVISFGFTRRTPADPVVGDLYICPDVARRNAAAAGVGVREELTRLVVHGVLHVLGHEHPESDGREGSAMWRRQEQLVRRLARPGRAAPRRA